MFGLVDGQLQTASRVPLRPLCSYCWDAHYRFHSPLLSVKRFQCLAARSGQGEDQARQIGAIMALPQDAQSDLKDIFQEIMALSQCKLTWMAGGHSLTISARARAGLTGAQRPRPASARVRQSVQCSRLFSIVKRLLRA